MPNNLERIEFLKKLHLFRGLSDNDMAAVAEELQERTFANSGVVFTEGAAADSMHIIYQGSVDISRVINKKLVKLGTLVQGDYYGEQGLLKGKKRNATITAERETVVLVLYQAQFNRLLAKSPSLRHNFDIMISSRKLALEKHYTWLAENEVIYFLARKHEIILIRNMILPVILLIPIAGLLALAFAFQSAALGAIGGFLFVIDLAWAVWRYIDWGNDYYIVTNKRVIWLEKVVGIYDSRTEAGINTILSVSTETTFWGRVFDYGIVVVRTYTGQIRLVYVHHPKQAAAMIEEYLTRAKEVGRKANEETMRRALRIKLGYLKESPPQVTSTPPAPPRQPKKKTGLAAWWENALRMRTENGDIITYHKHIYGFFRDAGPYAFGIFALIGLVIAWPIFQGHTLPMWLITLIIFAIFILVCVIVYVYIDWENDIYQVTSDQIIDINRKPFSTEDRKAAPLENILTTEYKRRGVLGMLLNFGTIYIMVGGAQFNFQDVADPPSVQQDIIRRQQGLILKKNEKAIDAERERMTDWLSMYHRTVDEVNHEKDQSEEPKSE